MGIFEQLDQRLARVELLLATIIDRQEKARSEAEEGALSIPHAAKMLDVSRSTIEKWLHEQKLTRIKAGKCCRIARSEINAVIRGEKVIEA